MTEQSKPSPYEIPNYTGIEGMQQLLQEIEKEERTEKFYELSRKYGRKYAVSWWNGIDTNQESQDVSNIFEMTTDGEKEQSRIRAAKESTPWRALERKLVDKVSPVVVQLLDGIIAAEGLKTRYRPRYSDKKFDKLDFYVAAASISPSRYRGIRAKYDDYSNAWEISVGHGVNYVLFPDEEPIVHLSGKDISRIQLSVQSGEEWAPHWRDVTLSEREIRPNNATIFRIELQKRTHIPIRQRDK